MKPYVIAGLAATVAGVFAGLSGTMVRILDVPGNLFFVFLPAVPFIAASPFSRKTRLRTALTVAGLGFASVLTYVIVFYAIHGVEDRAADPFCDEICITRFELWRVIVIVGAIVAAVFALVGGLIAFAIAAPTKRPEATA